MKKVISVLCALVLMISLSVVSGTTAEAEESQFVDVSYLTMLDESKGCSENSLARGEVLGTGDCSISKAGRGRIYVYASTTANTTVDYVSVTVSVEQYNETDKEWHQIDAWDTEKLDSYYVSTSKSIVVERGFYYRVHAVHYALISGVKGDFGNSLTDGILIP